MGEWWHAGKRQYKGVAGEVYEIYEIYTIWVVAVRLKEEGEGVKANKTNLGHNLKMKEKRNDTIGKSSKIKVSIINTRKTNLQISNCRDWLSSSESKVLKIRVLRQIWDSLPATLDIRAASDSGGRENEMRVTVRKRQDLILITLKLSLKW